MKQQQQIHTLERTSGKIFRFKTGKLLFLTAGLFAALFVCRAAAADDSVAPNPLDMKKAVAWFDSTAAKAANCEIKDGEITFTMGDYPTANIYRGQVIIPAELQSGVGYRLNMRITSDKDVKLPVRYLLNKAPYTTYASKDMDIKNGTNDYSIVFTPATVDGQYESPRSLRFMVGDLKSTTLTISDLKLTQE